MGCSASKNGKQKYPKSYFDTYSQNKINNQDTGVDRQGDKVFSSDNILFRKKYRENQQNKKHFSLNHTSKQDFQIQPKPIHSEGKLLQLEKKNSSSRDENRRIENKETGDAQEELKQQQTSQVFQEYQQHMQKIKEERAKYKNQSFNQYQNSYTQEKINNKARRGLSGNLFRKYGQRDSLQYANKFHKTDTSQSESPLKRNNNSKHNILENNLILNKIFSNKTAQNDSTILNNEKQILIKVNLNDETQEHTTTIRDEDNQTTKLQIRDSQVNYYPSRQYFKQDKFNSTQSPQQQLEQNISIQLNGSQYPQLQQPQQLIKKSSLQKNQQKTSNQSSLSVKQKNRQIMTRKSVEFTTPINQNRDYKHKVGKRKELNLQEVTLSNNLSNNKNPNANNNSQNNLDQTYKSPILRSNDRKETLDLRVDEQEYMYINRKRNSNNQFNMMSRHRIGSGSSCNFNNISSIQSPFIQASAFSEQLNF
ncbi:hypothetical protein PPERSA_08271 [Pseudocohnilembus persalinus]|uniref:Uncharacterized protein n=1 Tax=Pseudocohnilembus persalinus TaxID=266149 RepID=A0A0V0QG63_PSEPJ|nr:hypothetical protein PPERSA_08271 [Pseudocohnilembus persalinus]|eukprot:KRX01170.1 hypothetical protein PPERSA_08271 [Pseudocohnilembus persalinus]